jgi:hypothetical protein
MRPATFFTSLGFTEAASIAHYGDVCIRLRQRPFREMQLRWASKLFEFDYLHGFAPLIEL